MVGGDVAAGFLPKSNFSGAGADGAEAGAALLEGAPNIDGGLARADVDAGVEEGSEPGFAKGNGAGLLVSVLDAAGAGKGLVDAEAGAANSGCAGVGPNENEGAADAAGA